MTTTINPSFKILADGTATAGRVALVELFIQPGTEPPCHRHYWEDKLLYVLEGKIAVFNAGQWHMAPIGTAVPVPRGTEHTFAVLGHQAARLLLVFTPAGFEQLYQEMGTATPWIAREPYGLDRWVAKAARYGCEVTAPHPGQPYAFINA